MCIQAPRAWAFNPVGTPPCASTYISVSCIFALMKMTAADGTAPRINAILQIYSRGVSKANISNTTRHDSNMPQPCMEKTAAMKRPREPSGAPSAAIVAASGYSPPTPTPRKNRQSASCCTRPKGEASEVQTTHPLNTAPPMIKKHVAKNVPRLPIQSPNTPNTSWPIIAPTKVALATRLLEPTAKPPGCKRWRMEMTKSMTKRS
mmetsp:Transcript_48664/g.141897  ORF Transcript_48664/g.141897 Transcript_48664/m.141897 type:complete len:205 (-) Transcript_48664:228-842(-)